MTNSTPPRRTGSLFPSLLILACAVSVQGSLAGPSTSPKEPETNPTPAKTTLEGITFAEAADRLYLPVLELAGQFGWKVKPGEKSSDLVVN